MPICKNNFYLRIEAEGAVLVMKFAPTFSNRFPDPPFAMIFGIAFCVAPFESHKMTILSREINRFMAAKYCKNISAEIENTKICFCGMKAFLMWISGHHSKPTY